jgi:hypothetical protein
LTNGTGQCGSLGTYAAQHRAFGFRARCGFLDGVGLSGRRRERVKTDKEKTFMRKRNCTDPNQIEFRIIWKRSAYPFRLRAGDVIRYDNRLCRVTRVSECAAVVIMNRPTRDFKTRFDKPVRFTPSPALFRISADSPVEILNLKKHENR